MQTNLAESIRNTARGREADRILRACVHCGFCTATCPTYQVLGDELDGPRGRIYQIKLALEGAEPTRRTQRHLDRCLTCLNCVTTCPSGVEYHHLLDIGREYVEEHVDRALPARTLRWLLRKVLPFPARMRPLLRLGQALRPLLPTALRNKVPPPQAFDTPPATRHARRMLILDGCVQPAMTPRTNAVTAAVLDSIGVSAVSAPAAGCCGALSHHLSASAEARDFMRRNIDAWWPEIERGAEAIVTTASGCGAMVKEYGYHLRDDPDYCDRARRVSELAKDLCEVITPEDVSQLEGKRAGRIAFHPPCTLQHAQKLSGVTERLLSAAGFDLVPVPDSHLCCGSAGTYSILQPSMAGQLRERKLTALQSGDPDLIATANIGCQIHLQGESSVPVVHWIELLAQKEPSPQST
ncbi:MAG: glycolate oxidase subunit GlcF [Pseudomonadota bacterium]|nr:MAG: glycolate oxidase subunit GlcF [Pseudomonadota bacterium]